MLDYWFELTTMAALVAASAFFSGSEAALFSISRSDRGEMEAGSAGERRAASLLERPERLLTAVLFWNLVVNLTYYALTEVVSRRLSRAEGIGEWTPTLFTFEALLAIILLSEVLPKSLAVLQPRLISAMVSAPLAAATRAVDPVLPSLQGVSDAAARLLLPKLEPEPYMELADLERAVEFQSGETLDNESLMVQERQVLHRLVELADTTVAELMRPRHRCLVLPPPISLVDLEGRVAGCGEYVLVTEPDSDEITGAIPINRLAILPPDHIDARAEPLTIVPWCASASETLNQLREQGRRVAVVINEFGETIGIVPLEKLLDAMLRDASDTDPHDAHAAWIAPLGEQAWEASAATPLRHLSKRLGPWIDADDAIPTDSATVTDTFIAARSRTVGGLLQEELERPARMGDQIEVAGLVLSVSGGGSDDDADEPTVVRIEGATPTDANEGTDSDADPAEGKQ
ncbi:MAG: CNNM domain-containing protein [Planctomycetota bacterium]